jgi:predicted phage terminase large subunit-like protein
MLQMTMRLGARPRVVVSTTPRPIPLIRRLMKDAGTVIVRGSTYDNAANLSESFIASVRERYEGTRLGRQELYAEVLDDVPGALWTHAVIDGSRRKVAPDMARVVVAVDPSGGDSDGNDEQGIVVAGIGVDGECYVLADLTCKLTPDGWGRRAVKAYADWQADKLVYENNFGGAMVEHVIKTAAKDMGARVFTKEVKASRGKVVRAEPCAALYEQGKVHHVGSEFTALEDQMCLFTPTGEFDTSPDRVDALVWAMTELMFKEVVTLGAAPTMSGTRRADPRPIDDDDDEGERRWR